MSMAVCTITSRETAIVSLKELATCLLRWSFVKLTQADIESHQDPGNRLHRSDKPVPTHHTSGGSRGSSFGSFEPPLSPKTTPPICLEFISGLLQH